MTDQFDDWIATILRGDACPDARIAKVNFNSTRQIIKFNFEDNRKVEKLGNQIQEQVELPRNYDNNYDNNNFDNNNFDNNNFHL